MTGARHYEYLREMLAYFIAIGWSGDAEVAPRDFRFDLLLVRPDDCTVAVEVKRGAGSLHFSAVAEIASGAQNLDLTRSGGRAVVPVLATTQVVPLSVGEAARRVGVLIASTPDGPAEAARKIADVVSANAPDDAASYVAAFPTKEEVVRLLAQGYPTQEQVARVVREAGLEPVSVTDDLEPMQRWGAALAAAESQAKVNTLLEKSVALAAIGSFRTVSAVAGLAAIVIRYIAS